MDKMRKQAERWGATLHTEDVERVDFSVRPFVIESSERVVKAHSVILATGATAKRLKIRARRRSGAEASPRAPSATARRRSSRARSWRSSAAATPRRRRRCT